MDKVFKYYAFISYKHEDEKWAKWLQKRLETYRLPVALQKQNCPKQLKPVFRDSTDMTPGNLEEKLHENLELSNYLIVICSKNLAKESHYVDYEMKTFIDLGRSDKIIPFIVDGEPNANNPAEECFSELIKSFPGELLAANVKKDGKRTAALKVIASILKLNADDLIKRDKKRKKFQRFAGVILAIIAMIFLSTTLDLTAQNYEKEAINSNLYSDYTSSIKYAIKSLKVPFNKEDSGEAAQILRSHVIADELKKTNNQFRKEYEIKARNKRLVFVAESTDGTKVCFTDFSRIYVYDALTGKYIREFYRETEKDQLEAYLGFPIDEKLLYEPVYRIQNPDYNIDMFPMKHTEEIKVESENIFLYICDENGNVEKIYLIDERSHRKTYTESGDMVAVYRGEGNSSISIYSFENQAEFDLICPEGTSGVHNMHLSPKGRYLFAEFYDKYISGVQTLCVYDLESKKIIYEHKKDEDQYLEHWVFSKNNNRQAIYVFSAYKVEKYIYTDKTPDITYKAPGIKDNFFVSVHDDCEVLKKNIDLKRIYFSTDGTKAVMIHSPYGYDLYTFFDVKTGKHFMSLAIDRVEDDYNTVNVTPDIKYAIACFNGKISILEIETAATICEIDCSNEVICSTAISNDGNNAAYINEEAVLTVLTKKDGGYKAQTVTGLNPNGWEIEILFINNKECVFNCDGTIRSYNIETGEIKTIADNVDGVEYNNMICQFSIFKSTRELDNGIILDPSYNNVFTFYNTEGKPVNTSGNISLLPSAYYPEKNLLVGTEYSHQEQYNSEIVAVEYEGDTHNILYRYSSSIEVSDIAMDNNGKYVIINGPEGCEVLDALTGDLLFTLDRNILIHDDVVYDISGDLVLPDALPHAEICSINKFISKGEDIIG